MAESCKNVVSIIAYKTWNEELLWFTANTDSNCLESEEIVFQQPEFHSHVFRNIEEMRNERILCDVTIKVDDKSFFVHRLVLASTIPYFRTMFTTNMKERRQKEILIKGINAETFEKFVNLAYTGHVSINKGNLVPFIFGASYLQCTEMLDACIDFLVKRVNPNNVLVVKHIAEMLSNFQLTKTVDECINKYFEEITSTHEYLFLNAEQLIEILYRNELCVTSEEKIFEAVMLWIEADEDSRKIYLPKLLAHVRMLLLNSTYFFVRVYKNQLVNSFDECRDLLSALEYHIIQNHCKISLLYSNSKRSDIFSKYPYFVRDGWFNFDSSRSEGLITFNVNDIGNIERITSPEVKIYNISWSILVTKNEKNNELGFFLKCEDFKNTALLRCHVSSQLRICSKGVPKLIRNFRHMFDYSTKGGFGFPKFTMLGTIINPENGYVNDNIVTFQIHVIVNSVHGINWDSRKYTGYVGFKHQENLSYQHSLLQTLYCIKKFREEVLKFSTENNADTETIAKLREIFNLLQCSNEPININTIQNDSEVINENTKNVTTTRQGVRTSKAKRRKLQQSDYWMCSPIIKNVEIFLEMLINDLFTNTNCDSIKNLVRQLFEGVIEVTIMCKNVNEEVTKHTETFYYIQLNVKDCENVYESLLDFVKVRTLSNDDQFKTEKFGSQKAVKFKKFVSFPPVLFLSLARFNFNSAENNFIKYNGRFEFYKKICLDHFLQDSSTAALNYTLFAVLVHTDCNEDKENPTLHVVYIDPKGSGQWYKFDDEIVSKCSKSEATDFNFGRETKDLPWYMRPNTNAYMLVYIRDSELENILML